MLAQKPPEFVDPAPPSQLVFEQQVIVALERHETRARDETRDQAALGEGHSRVAHTMQDERRTGDLREERYDVDFVEHAHEAPGIHGRGRNALQLVEPAMLLGSAAGNELRGEELPKSRILLAPAQLCQLAHHLGFFALALAGTPVQAPAGVSAVEDELTYALRMAHRISHCDRRALRVPEQREAIDAGVLDDRFQVPVPGLE